MRRGKAGIAGRCRKGRVGGHVCFRVVSWGEDDPLSLVAVMKGDRRGELTSLSVARLLVDGGEADH